MNSELQIYINGKYYSKSEAKISVYDHAFLHGDGVFEGIRVYNGIVFKLKEHIDRLYRSAHAIMLNISLTKEEITAAVLETLRKNDKKDGYVRLNVSRGVGDLGLDPRKYPKASVTIIADKISIRSESAKQTGVTAMFSWVHRNPVDAASHEAKSLNYLNSIMAKLEANNCGVDEAICLEENGYVAEGTGENVFIVRNGEVFTPPISTGALEGITSDAIVDLCKKLQIRVNVANLTPFMVFTADEVFFTGTAMEVIAVREVNKRQIGDGKPGPVTKRLMVEFQKIVGDPSYGLKL
jgi:branched-chain amino acid aminotransferase